MWAGGAVPAQDAVPGVGRNNSNNALLEKLSVSGEGVHAAFGVNNAKTSLIHGCQSLTSWEPGKNVADDKAPDKGTNK